MSNSIFMLSKYLKKTVTTALILGLMISPILPATQSISSSISIAAQAAEIEVQLDEAQATNGEWSEYANTAWYYANPDESTYTIATADQLAGLAKLVNDGVCKFAGKTIKLTADIDLGDHYWVPIGTEKNPFKGNVNGQGYTISNLHIGTIEAFASYKYAGLFGLVKADNGETITIENVNIDKNSWVYNSAGCTGGICARVGATKTSSVTINNCNNSADVFSSSGYSGGICADATLASNGRNLTINNCSNSGYISSSNKSAGGICAIAKGKITISNCSNSAIVSSYYCSGGICGEVNPNTTINNCYYKEGTANRGICKKNNQTDPEDQPGEITALPESQMTAATGTMDEDWVDITIDGDDKGKMALVDALNNYVDNNLSDGLLNWIQDDNVNKGYPTILTNNNNAD